MTYIGNELQWKQLVEVDWLGQYVKAWVAFNAWYSNNFRHPDAGKRFRDREIIEKIKNDEGNVRSKVERLLSGEGSDQKSFQTNLADLHKSLGDVTVKLSGIRVSFEEVEDYKSAKSIDRKHFGIQYNIEVNPDKRNRLITVKNRANTNIFDEVITSSDEEKFKGVKWFEDLRESGFFVKLNPHQMKYLRTYITESTPIHNLLYKHVGDFTDPDVSYIDIGQYKFINDKVLIARSLIEILYKLRNSLFHGEVVPNDVQNVYQNAYLILKYIIPDGV